MINIKELRIGVEETFGQKITTAKQCRMLEEAILAESNRRISSATLRRFFGLLPSSSKLSPYNVDTLVIYSRFNQEKKESVSTDTLWNDIKKEAGSYTKYYLSSIKKKSLSDYDSSIRRLPIEDKLNEFVQSKLLFTSVTAPGGYGKSTMLGKWIETKFEKQSDIILFTNALIFENTFQYNGQHTNFIDFSGNNTNSVQIINENNLQNGKFVIVVDGIDELSLHIEKLKRFVQWFVDFLIQHSNCDWLKVIFSLRDITYEKYLLPFFKQSYIQSEYFNRIPVPLFKQKELLSVFQTTYNNNDLNSILCHITNPEISSLLQIPINLALYKANLTQNKNNVEVNTHSLYQHLLSNYVYKSFCAEEKIDIIECILGEIIGQNIGFNVRKNLIKKQYPIHLKQNGNYHLAYNELVNDGILHEFINEENGQIATYYTGFKHINFYYYLSAYFLIKKNNGLDIKLLNDVVSEYENLEFKINVLCHLFCIAFESKNLEVVCHFFHLDEEIFSTINLSIVIGICLRKRSLFQEEVINALACNTTAQKFLFELFVDVNNLVLSFNNQLKVYSQYKKDNEAQLFTTSLHLYHSLLTLNKKEATQYYNILEGIEFTEDTFPWPVGRKIAYTILYDVFCKNKPNTYSFEELISIRKIAYSNFHNGYQKEFLFDVSIVYSLMLSSNYQLAQEYGEAVISEVEKIKYAENFYYYAESFHYDVITSLLIYARFKQGLDISIQDVEKLPSFTVTNASHYSSYQYMILINFYASELYMNCGLEQKGKECFNMAIRLCKYSKYDFLLAFILFNNPFLNDKIKAKGLQMFTSNGFKIG